MLTNSADERYMKPRFEPLLNKAREGTTGKTLFGDFAEKLDELTDTLGATTVSFVRCIKVYSLPSPARHCELPLCALGTRASPLSAL